MKTLKLLVILALPFMAACVSNEKTPTPVVDENTIPGQPSGELIRAYVESNDFIDVDYKAIEYATINPTSSRAENVTEEDHAKMMAAVYRFQKHVSVIDGLYSCSLKNGAEINISEELFKSMIDNLEEMNSFIKEYTEKGEKVNVIEPTEEYLESLLK